MNISLNNVLSLTYNRENQFLGEVSRYRSVKNYAIEGVFHSGQHVNNDDILNFPLKATVTGYYNTDTLDTVSVNGVSLGDGRITNLSIPQGDHIKRGVYNINFSVYEDGDLSNITSDPNYAGLATMGSAKLIDNISETFNFTVAPNNNYNYDHTLTVTYIDHSTDAITLAKTLANQIFSATLPFPLFSDPTISTTYNTAGKKYFTETFNLINKTCTFTKRFEVLNNVQTDYTHEYKNSISIDQNGIVAASENGIIKIKTTPFSSYINSASNTVQGGAYARCNTLFTNIVGNLSILGANYESLNSIPLISSKTINNLAGEIQYSVTFANNAYLYQKSNIYGSHEFTVSLDKSENRVVNVNENGVFTIIGKKSDSYTTSNIVNLGQTLMEESATRCSNFYSSLNFSSTLKELGRSMDFGKHFKSLNYTINYTDDATILTNNPHFTKIAYQIGADKANHMYQEYRIPNIAPFDTKGIYLYAGDQSNMGRVSLDIKAVAKRESNENTISDTITNLISTAKFNYLVNEFAAAKRMTSFSYSKQGNALPDNFVEACSYTADSDRNVNLTLSDAFVAKADKYGSDL
jgi:hypothetical protein